MADPVSLTAISLGASAAGAGVSAFGSLMSGNAQSSAYTYQASLARMNEQIAKQNASYETASGEVQAQESGMKTRFQEGQTKVAQGASNLDVNSGTSSLVRTSEQEIGYQDQAIIRSNAARRAYGYNVEASQDEAQAQVDTMAAKNSKSAGVIGALSSVLGGAASVSSKWSSASTSGVFGNNAGYYGGSPSNNSNLGSF